MQKGSEAAKFAYANKTKKSINFQKLGPWDFWQIADSVLNKGKSAIPPLFAENVSKNCNLDDSGISGFLF